MKRLLIAVFAIALIAIPFSAFAGGGEHAKTAVSPNGPHAPVAPPAVGDLLLDHTTGTTTQGLIALNEVEDDLWDSWGADDFTISDDGWLIDAVWVDGFYDDFFWPSHVPEGLEVYFYEDNAGAPGDLQCFELAPITDDMDGALLAELATPCELPDGDYWMAIGVYMNWTLYGPWYWFMKPEEGQYPAMWVNPNGGYTDVCTTWNDLATCLDDPTVDEGFAFQLFGEVLVDAPPPAVPGIPVPNKGLIQIGTWQAQPAYGSAGGEAVPGIVLPADADGNGFDTYVVTGSAVVDGETWYSLFLGSATWVWVPATNVTPLTELP